jgi:hypothetical protein
MKGPRLLLLRETGGVELHFLIYRIQYTDIAIARRPNFGASPAHIFIKAEACSASRLMR